MVEELMQDDRQFRNPIRVVVPSGRTTEQKTTGHSDRDQVDQGQPATSDQPNRIRIPTLPSPGNDRIGEAAHRCEPIDGEQSASVSRTVFRPDSRKSPAANDALPRVTVEVRNGELFLYSNDDVALDEIENTIRELVRQRDQAVLDTRPAVKVIRVNRHEVPYLQSVLGSLPQISITDSGETPSDSRPSRVSGNGNQTGTPRRSEQRDRD